MKPKKAQDVELLALQIRRLANELEGVGAKLKAVALTAEELKTLLGELRAIRHLIDRKGEFKHLDQVADPPAFSLRCPSCGKGLPSDKDTHCGNCGAGWDLDPRFDKSGAPDPRP